VGVKKMKTRRLVSLTVLVSFIILAFSGIMLFLSPQGRVAYWAGWEMLGLSKDQWSAVHTTFMVLFLTMGIWHTVLNWKPIVGYLKDRTRRVRMTRPELLAALGIGLLFIVGPLTGIPPFRQFLDAGEAIKAYWERTRGSPPWGHAEESSLASFCRRIVRFQPPGVGASLAVDCQEAMIALAAAGIVVSDSSQTLMDIAGNNGVTPQAIADVVLSVGRPVEVAGSPEERSEAGLGARQDQWHYPHPGSGMGRLTLRDYAERFDLELPEILAVLSEKGVEIDPDVPLREEAARLGATPVWIFEVLNQEGQLP
jgi:hypothetical protein